MWVSNVKLYKEFRLYKFIFPRKSWQSLGLAWWWFCETIFVYKICFANLATWNPDGFLAVTS